jgi:hypothetical protein
MKNVFWDVAQCRFINPHSANPRRWHSSDICIIEQVKTEMTGSNYVVFTLVAVRHSVITELENVLYCLF